MHLEQPLHRLASAATQLCGYKVDVLTAQAADSLFVCAATEIDALLAVGKVAKLLKWAFVEILEDGPDDWGHYYRVIQAGAGKGSSAKTALSAK